MTHGQREKIVERKGWNDYSSPAENKKVFEEILHDDSDELFADVIPL